MTNLTDSFLENIINFSKRTFTENQKHQAKRCFLDYLAATYAGHALMENRENFFNTELGEVQGGFCVIGSNIKTSLERAAFINGLQAHLAELDDGVISGIIHPGAPLFSALIPYAEKEKITGEDFVKATIVAYEASVRLAESIQPSHKLRGYHATATCGMIGVVLAISIIKKYSFEKTKNAFSTAIISAFGTLKVLEDDSQLKPYNVALAAQTAVVAVAMAQSGFKGPNDVLSGKYGFISMLSEEFDESKILDFNKEDKLAIEKVYVKPYAACRYCHPAIDATLNIRSKNRIKLEAIDSIEVYTYSLAVRKHDHVEIDNISSAKMSIPYSVAVSFITGQAGLQEFTDKFINTNEIIDLTKKVEVHSSEKFTKLFPKYSMAEVIVNTNDGGRYSDFVEQPKGEPETCLTDEELSQKFVNFSLFAGRSNEFSQKVINKIWDLEENFLDLLDNIN